MLSNRLEPEALKTEIHGRLSDDHLHEPWGLRRDSAITTALNIAKELAVNLNELEMRWLFSEATKQGFVRSFAKHERQEAEVALLAQSIMAHYDRVYPCPNPTR